MNRTFLLAGALAVALMAYLAFIVFRGDGALQPSRDRASSLRPDCRKMWERGFELQGVVGDRGTQAYFDTPAAANGIPEKQLSGVVRFPDERVDEALADTLIGLTGPAGDDRCVVQLKEDSADNESALWHLQFERGDRLSGTRQSADGRTEPIALTIVPQTPCDTASEWRPFTSPKWPIVFDYPASWRLTEDVDSVTLECPSITALAGRRSSLTFERGRFAPSGTTPGTGADDSFTDPYWFLKVGDDDWRIGPFGCAESASDIEHTRNCPPARRSARNGVTMLQGAVGEHRLYRPGVGYLGQGPGITRYLFIVGDQWVSLDSAGENGHYADVGNKGGPVLLEGEAIGDRVVRSVAASSR